MTQKRASERASERAERESERVRERVRERVMAALKEKRVSKRKQLAWLATLSEASAGALGQLFSTLLLYPLDTSKTRIQACLEENASKQNEEEEEEEEAQEITEIEEKQKQKKKKENWKEWALSLYTGIEAKVNRETESLANSHKTPKPSGRLILLTATVFFSPSFLLLLSPKNTGFPDARVSILVLLHLRVHQEETQVVWKTNPSFRQRPHWNVGR